ncbi:MAG: NAD(P)-binding domain-containing protein [Alphaproteobacteria bacterium]|nr:NAD(P)-binding domain-containing protein [Alphaproteobacteria bacterium]
MDIRPHLSIIGAGKFGTVLARAAVEAGYDTVLARSGPPESIEMLVDILAPGARAVTLADAVAHASMIILAVPSWRFRELPPDTFAGKILIDTINYWEQTDGVIPEFAEAPADTSLAVQRHFPSARLVKSLNQLGYNQFRDERQPRGTPGRIGMAAAGNDRDAVRSVLRLIDDLGFDPVDAGPLAAGAALGPGGPAFGVVETRDRLLTQLGLEVEAR